MSRGLKLLVVGAVALALIMAGIVLVKESGLDTSKIQEVYIEVITEEGDIERMQVTDSKDVEAIKLAFSGETTSDGAGSFTEGGYRIVLAQPDKEWHLYPKGIDLTQVRIGDSGTTFVVNEDVAELDKIINKYIDTHKYDKEYDWKKVIMDQIKNES